MRVSSPIGRRARATALAVLASSTLALAPAAVATSVWYAGPGPTGRPTTLEITVDEDGAARGRIFAAPTQAGETAGFDLTFDGTATRDGSRIRIDAIARGDGFPVDGVDLRLIADAVPRRGGGLAEPDPLGSALVTFLPDAAPAWQASLPAIAIGVHSRTALDDGTLEVSAFGPFFYAEPWSELQIAPDPTDLAESVLTGLEQRSADPDSVSGLWWDERTVEIAALTPRLTSVRLTFSSFTGGAHPNTWFAFATWLRSDDSWRQIDACGALRALDYVCDPVALRAAIVVDLLAQGAAWVTEGSVDATTPWLLDPFTVTVAGLRFDYAPYDVGPYADGPFRVLIPFSSLRAR